MSDLAALAIVSCVVVPSALAYRLASRWLAAREAIAGLATKAELAEVKKHADVAKAAVSNLAKEVDEKLSGFESRQVGLFAGMHQPRRSIR